MKQPRTILFLLAFAILAPGVPGCASRNVNPPQARANTGYMDFYAVNADDLCWDITDVKRNKKVFYEFHPVKEPVLRLAFQPGRYPLRVAFLNHVITVPGVADVEVQDGKVTPVRVTLTEAGTALVQTKEISRGGTVYGRYGRRARISSTGSVSYEVSAEPQPPLPFQLRAQMPYAVEPDN
jgi:hypothetical protein